MSLDGIAPLHAVVHVLASTANQFWSRGSNQSAYMPYDLFIIHVCFYAVHPSLVHEAHKGLELHPFRLHEGTAMPTESSGGQSADAAIDSFEYESPTLKDRVAQTVQSVEVGQLNLQSAPPPIRIVVVASDKEPTGGCLLVDALAAVSEYWLQSGSVFGGSLSAETEACDSCDRSLRVFFG